MARFQASTVVQGTMYRMCTHAFQRVAIEIRTDTSIDWKLNSPFEGSTNRFNKDSARNWFAGG